jgi:KDO2-lipid IV(A) lauroyltransferase
LLLNRLLYYAFVYPISKLPLGIIYFVFYFLFLIIYYIIPYRKKVVKNNIQSSFPKNSKKENNIIVKNFYKYFIKLLAESVRNLNISRKNLSKRIIVKNPEIMHKLYQQNKNVLLVSSHFNNWEFLITAQNFLFPHQAIGIGMPMTNKFWDKKINTQRERFGMKVVNATNYKEKLKEFESTPTATLILGDQNPSKIYNSFWTTFLSKDTAFFFGAEIMANQLNSAVVYASIQNIKKGVYEIELSLITDEPKNEPYGFITQSAIDILESDINKKPEFWLWSHKRWKMGVPDNLPQIKKEHQERFESKFR